MIDSIELSKAAGIQHRSILQLFDKYRERFDKYEVIENIIQTAGRPKRNLLFDTDSLFFMILLLKNSPKSVKLKAEASRVAAAIGKATNMPIFEIFPFMVDRL